MEKYGHGALKRAGTGTANSMFSITDNEFSILITEFLKINPFSSEKWRIKNPYPYHDTNIFDVMHIKENGYPSYESTIMTLLSIGFNKRHYKQLFGNYSEYLSYVPTSLGKEMDFLLMYSHPQNKEQILSYDIIEVKKDKFTIDNGLRQLIEYESWFLQKKVSGDLKMLRTTAIALSFSDDVIEYVNKRNLIEGKNIKLLTYKPSDSGFLELINKN